MKPERFSTLSFDCYGTLIDWETGILGVLRPWAARHGLTVTDEALLEAFGRHETRVQQANPGSLYPDVLGEVQRAIAADFGVAPSVDDEEAFAASVGDWPAFADCAETLAYLKRHYRLVVLSNVDNASFVRSNARLGVTFDAIITAQDVGAYKPDLRMFHIMLEQLAEIGVGADAILHTAQSLYHDIAPARRVGLATNWINRRAGKPGLGVTPAADAAPDFEHPSLAAFVARHKAEVGA